VKPGVTIELNGLPFLTLEYHHNKTAQMARIKVKLKNLRTGAIIEKTFNVGDKVERAHIERRNMQYLYHDENLYHFMDKENFEQIAIPGDKLGDSVRYFKDGATVTIMFYEKDPLGVDMPTSVVMKVVETPPGFKGDTVSGGNKPAKLESGLTVQVPMFVNTGDKIKVDTRSGKYVERA
jgi:elongation factor P